MSQNFREKLFDKEQAVNEKIRQDELNTKTFLKYAQVPGGGVQPVLYSQAPGQAEPMPVKMGSVSGPAKPTEQWSEPYIKKVGKNEILVQRNLSTNQEKSVGSGGPLASQTVNNYTGNRAVGAAEKKAAEEFGSGIGERVNTRVKAAEEGRNQNQQLDFVKLAISKGARTGYGEETLLNLRSLAETFGIDTGDLSGQELIRKTSNEMALRLRNPDSGLGLTGNTSNKDLDFLKNSVVGLGRTERGNLRIIDAMQRFNKLKIAVGKKQQEIISKNNGVPPLGLDEKLIQFVNNYKMFTPKELREMKNLSRPIKATYTEKGTGRKVVEFSDGTLEYAD